MADTPSKKLGKKIKELQQRKSLLRSRINAARIESNPNSKSREQKGRELNIEEMERQFAQLEHEITAQTYHANRLKNSENLEEKDKKEDIYQPSDQENNEIPEKVGGAYGGIVDDPAFRARRTLIRTPPLKEATPPHDATSQNIPKNSVSTSTTTISCTVPSTNTYTTSSNPTSNIHSIGSNTILIQTLILQIQIQLHSHFQLLHQI